MIDEAAIRQRYLSLKGALDERVHAIIGTCLYVRAFLGVYLSAKLLHVVVTSVDWSGVDWRIVPW